MGPKALPAPEFLDAVILHQSGTNDLHLVYERPSAHLPWHDV
ncbi:MAG TPA: hypothetical protein VFX15_02525 [Actinomycetes bacterium]|nr:hypothetical protein [Actinomycetes bacterium]